MLKRIVLAAFVLGTVAGGVVVSYRSWEKKEAPSPPPPPQQAQLQGTELDEWVDGRKVWSLKSERVTYDGGRLAVLKQIEARFWEGSRMVSSARSPQATLDLPSRKVQMEGGITIESKMDDASVHADRIDWSGGQRRLHATGDVTFRRGTNVVRCRELWADASLRTVSMQGPVSARFDLEIQ